MIKLLIAVLTIGSVTLPAQGRVILPSIFATEFCSLRDRGLGYKDSLEMAAKGAMIEGEPKRVLFHGVLVDDDVLKAYEAAKIICPQHMATTF